MKTKIAADWMRRTPQEMADQIEYLTIDKEWDHIEPFIPYLKGIETFGQYTIYDDDYKPIPFFEPSGLVPQTYLFMNAKPGKHMVSLIITYETAEAKSGYQYFFGVIVPERTISPTPSAQSTSSPDPVGAYLVVIDHLIANRRITVPPFKYLAIDTANLPGLTATEKERLFAGLDKYHLQLLDKTHDELIAEGYMNRWAFIDNGAFINLADIRMNGSVMTLDASIYLNELNAYGLDDFDVSWLGTHWEITRTHMTWVS